ncbi:hypothetical protein T10_6632 [Trichinella papuae]|uniref:Uncharacterized protein n=1 Tax=Trichinella papuae TaxID=268474 RepID=A0A0V1MT89_9BILA|nr:hypothetical protein T10_6632 [Trichinella papuae]
MSHCSCGESLQKVPNRRTHLLPQGLATPIGWSRVAQCHNDAEFTFCYCKLDQSYALSYDYALRFLQRLCVFVSIGGNGDRTRDGVYNFGACSKECVRRKSTLSNSERPKETAITEAAAFVASCVSRGLLSDYHKARGCQAPLLIIKAPLCVGCLKPAFHSSRQMPVSRCTWNTWQNKKHG